MFREPGYHQSGCTDLRVDTFNFPPLKVKRLQEAFSFHLPGLGADWAWAKFDHHDSQVPGMMEVGGQLQEKRSEFA